MNIVEATRRYETWLGEAVPLVPRDLKLKHLTMQASAFGFLRATYYRWAQQFPKVLSAGGAGALDPRRRRPASGEFRHLARRRGAARLGHQRFRRGPSRRLCQRPGAAGQRADRDRRGQPLYRRRTRGGGILAGYARAMAEKEGRPFVLEEDNTELRALAMSDARSPKKFWKKIWPRNPPRRPTRPRRC